MNQAPGVEFAEGAELPALSVRLTRTDLVRYAGASGDLNPIHWSERVASQAGLPGVVAHGMLTMALGSRLVTAWLGDPSAVLSYQVRFTRPVPVPDVVAGVDSEPGALLELTGRLAEVIEPAEPGADTAPPGGTGRTGRVEVTAKLADKTVLGKATVLVRLPA